MKKINIFILMIIIVSFMSLSLYNFKLYKDRQSLYNLCEQYDIRYQQLYVDALKMQKKLFELRQKQRIIVSATAYTACKTECDSNPNQTAILTRPIPGRTIAVSRDLIYLLGKRVYIEGLGIRKVEDLMNPRFKNKIDVLVASKTEARKFGLKRGITIAPL